METQPTTPPTKTDQSREIRWRRRAATLDQITAEAHGNLKLSGRAILKNVREKFGRGIDVGCFYALRREIWGHVAGDSPPYSHDTYIGHVSIGGRLSSAEKELLATFDGEANPTPFLSLLSHCGRGIWADRYSRTIAYNRRYKPRRAKEKNLRCLFASGPFSEEPTPEPVDEPCAGYDEWAYEETTSRRANPPQLALAPPPKKTPPVTHHALDAAVEVRLQSTAPAAVLARVLAAFNGLKLQVTTTTTESCILITANETGGEK